MGDVVVNIQHLGLSVAAVGDKEFNIEIIAFVEVVRRKGALDFDVSVS